MRATKVLQKQTKGSRQKGMEGISCPDQRRLTRQVVRIAKIGRDDRAATSAEPKEAGDLPASSSGQISQEARASTIPDPPLLTSSSN